LRKVPEVKIIFILEGGEVGLKRVGSADKRGSGVSVHCGEMFIYRRRR